MADYYSVIARALSNVPNKTDEARRTLYDRARTTLQDKLRGHDAAELANEHSALEAAIRKVETETLFSEIRREREKYSALSKKRRFMLAAKEFVRAARDKLNDRVSTMPAKMVPTKFLIAAGLVESLALVQRMQFKVKNLGRQILLKR